MEAPPVVLALDMYRLRDCGKQVRRALAYMPGVTRFSVSRRTGTVAVSGDMRMDVRMLRRRLEQYMGRTVTVVSYGGRPHRSPYEQEIVPYYPPAAAAYPYHPPVGAAYPYHPPVGAAYPYHQYQYQHYAPPPPPPPQQQPYYAYPYHQYQHYAPPPPPPPQQPYYGGQGQYGGPPSIFDDTIPGNACTIM